eukprot:CAMPEP_0185596266 /NCGR_PEP_ID=MMETSP0434-20130131/80653_1 /TAXON_ID=626734 ORGANISM="Favella taraikaensis, Strain Fe Narragansett Bay" /NCGR_SAMPLE_ID=MMETSP0434 /ASSEMBLY_ACC=CAM_ASM_000379 /LENGTH=106 /DNA_ID=CAMNT_0028224743 /DNA_START=790 /DNA_END=1110 /DNA_ORIENTATION=+
MEVLGGARHEFLVAPEDEEDCQTEVDGAEHAEEGREAEGVDGARDRHREEQGEREDGSPEALAPRVRYNKTGQLVLVPKEQENFWEHLLDVDDVAHDEAHEAEQVE